MTPARAKPGWLRHDPVTPLLDSGNPAVAYFTRRDLWDEHVPPAQTLWSLPHATRLLRKQQPDGLWRPHILKNKHIEPHLWISLGICRVARRLGAL